MKETPEKNGEQEENGNVLPFPNSLTSELTDFTPVLPLYVTSPFTLQAPGSKEKDEAVWPCGVPTALTPG